MTEKREPRVMLDDEIDGVVNYARTVLTVDAPDTDTTAYLARRVLDLVETIKQTNHEATSDRQTLTALRGVIRRAGDFDEGREVVAADKLVGEHDEYARQLRHIRDDLERAGFKSDDYYEAPNGVRFALDALREARARNTSSLLDKLGEVWRACEPLGVTSDDPLAAVREVIAELNTIAEVVHVDTRLGEVLTAVTDVIQERDNARGDLAAVRGTVTNIVPDELVHLPVSSVRWLVDERRRVVAVVAQEPTNPPTDLVTNIGALVVAYRSNRDALARIAETVKVVAGVTVADKVVFAERQRLDLINELGRIGALLGDTDDPFGEVSELLAERRQIREAIDGAGAPFEGGELLARVREVVKAHRNHVEHYITTGKHVERVFGRTLAVEHVLNECDVILSLLERYDLGKFESYRIAEGVRRLAGKCDELLDEFGEVKSGLLAHGFPVHDDERPSTTLGRVYDLLGELRADRQRVSDVVTVLVREGIAGDWHENIIAVGEGVNRLAERYKREYQYTRRLIDELLSVKNERKNLVLALAEVLGIADDGEYEGKRCDENVLAHVTSLVADKHQLVEFVDNILKPLGVRYDGDMPATVVGVNRIVSRYTSDREFAEATVLALCSRLGVTWRGKEGRDGVLNEVEAIGTKVALWREERRRIVEYIEKEYGGNQPPSDDLSVYNLVLAVLREWQAYGQEVARDVCAILDRELIDGDSLPDRVERLVTLLREAEQSKERVRAELTEAQQARDAHAASLDVFVQESCELVELIAGAGVARGMVKPMVEKLVNRATRDAALLRQVVEVLAEFELAFKHEAVTNVVNRVRTLADKSLKKDIAPSESKTLGLILTEAGAPAHGLTLVERVRWLARQRDNYKTHALGRGLYAEQMNRRAYEALRAAGVSPVYNMHEGIELIAQERSRSRALLDEAHAVITARFGSSGIVADTLTLVERLEGAARMHDIHHENDRVLTDTMLELEQHWSRFCKEVERIRATYTPVAFPSRLSAHDIVPFVETLATHARYANDATTYLSERSHYRPRVSSNIHEAVVELDNAFETARVLGEEARAERDGLKKFDGLMRSEREQVAALVEPYAERGDGTLTGAVKRLLSRACTVNEHHVHGALLEIAELTHAVKPTPSEVVKAVKEVVRQRDGFLKDLDALAGAGLEPTVKGLVVLLLDYRNAERALRVAGMFEGETLTDAVRSLGTRFVNTELEASGSRSQLDDIAATLGVKEAEPHMRAIRVMQLARHLLVEAGRLDDALGFARNLGNDRHGAVCDIVAREVKFKNRLAEALGLETTDNLILAAQTLRATRNELSDDLGRIQRALGEIRPGDKLASADLVSEAVELLVAHHSAAVERLNQFERAAFDEYKTAREAFEFGVTTGVGGDLDDDERLKAFGRWYESRGDREGTAVAVDRRKLAHAAFEYAATSEVLSDTDARQRREVFEAWYGAETLGAHASNEREGDSEA